MVIESGHSGIGVVAGPISGQSAAHLTCFQLVAACDIIEWNHRATADISQSNGGCRPISTLVQMSYYA